MDRLSKRQNTIRPKGPGKNPALVGFLWGVLFFAFAPLCAAVDFQTFEPYTPRVTGGSDARSGGTRDAQFDARRAVIQFQERARREERTKERSEEKEMVTGQALGIEQHVAQEKQVSQATSQHQHQDGEFIYNRTTGIDQYSADKDGGYWWSKVGLLFKAWNVLSRDLYANESRSEMTDFTFNDLLNITGMNRKTVDQAGRVTDAIISDITYQEGETLRNFLSKNKEATRTEVSTTHHPTGDQTTRTRIYDIVYNEEQVVSQKAEIFDLSGPNNPILQETFDMKYDKEGNVIGAKTRITDTLTGVVTESKTDSSFNGNRVVSSVSTSKTFDPYRNTLTEQLSTQSVSYGGGTQVDAKTTTTIYSTDSEGNITRDFKTVTESTQVMENFFGIPELVESLSNTLTEDFLEVQTVRSESKQFFARDKHGNLLSARGLESGTTVNFDGSVTQTTESTMDFTVVADQPYLTGRSDKTFTKDMNRNSDSTTASTLTVRLGAKGEVLNGTREAETFSSNGDGSISSTLRVIEDYDRAGLVNDLGLIRRVTTNRTKNEIDLTDEEETRIYLQTHDDFNRVLSAEETIEGSGTTLDNVGSWTRTSGRVEYAVSERTLRPYAVKTTVTTTAFNAIDLLLTEATQIQTVDADKATGRILGGEGRTQSTSFVTDQEGNVVKVRRGDVYTPAMGDRGDPDELIPVVTVRTESIEHFVGLEHANALGLTTRETVTDNLDVRSHDRTVVREVLTQNLNSVGKVLGAKGVTRSVSDDEWGYGVSRTESYIETEYFLTDDNRILPSILKIVEVTKDRNDGAYRVVVREDRTRYDDFGRIHEVDNRNPSQGGFERIWYQDVTVRPIPPDAETPEQIFERFFGNASPTLLSETSGTLRNGDAPTPFHPFDLPHGWILRMFGRTR